MKKILLLLSILVTLAVLVFFFLAASLVDKKLNASQLEGEPEVSEKAQELHPKLTIADWHSDNLLWDRDILDRLDYGHVDVPRLIEGNYTLQVFDAVIKTPRGQNYQSTAPDSDNITFLAMANRWPIMTWGSLFERAVYQSEKLHRAADNSDGRLKIVKSKSELKQFLKNRSRNQSQVAGVLSIEGLHALEGDITNLKKLYDSGYRIMGPVHFFDNKLGGASSGLEKGGLTDFGRQVVKQMNEMNIIIDLAHASPKLIDDIIEQSNKPVIVSHTGVRGTCDSPRNLSDKAIKTIAQKGGLIGIGFWKGAICSIQPKAIVKAIKYVVDLVGIEHVSLGSDFDGSVTTYFNSAQIIVLTDALLDNGFSENEVRLIMGENQIRFLLNHLPNS